MSEIPLREVWVLHGPNLNLLGTREPAIYGTVTLPEIDADLQARGSALGVRVVAYQTNHEGVLMDWIQAAVVQKVDALLINPAAFTHTSIGLRDALSVFEGVKVEVHLSNIASREEFRQQSFVSGVVDAVVSGFGPDSYRLALQGAISILRKRLQEGSR
ncbi:MAG: type II 3-dehydroquinate dehydratase [Candidatus Sericytochromatia bacterium]|nr:type II 3-dehydroquinate dehydratase [Candidatus Sericytochromatia bacterium]